MLALNILTDRKERDRGEKDITNCFREAIDLICHNIITCIKAPALARRKRINNTALKHQLSFKQWPLGSQSYLVLEMEV